MMTKNDGELCTNCLRWGDGVWRAWLKNAKQLLFFWRKKERKLSCAQVNERVKWGGEEAGEETNDKKSQNDFHQFSSFLFWSRLWSSTLIQLFFPPFASTSSRQDVETRADERTRKWWWFFFAAAFFVKHQHDCLSSQLFPFFSPSFFSLQLVNVERNHAPAPLRWRLRSLNCRLLLRVLSFLFFGGKFLKFARSYTLQAFECLLCCPLENKSFFRVEWNQDSCSNNLRRSVACSEWEADLARTMEKLWISNLQRFQVEATTGWNA